MANGVKPSAADQVHMGEVYDASASHLKTIEEDIQSAITSLVGSTSTPSQADLLAIQYKLQVFGFFMEFASSFEKKLSDVFERTIGKF